MHPGAFPAGLATLLFVSPQGCGAASCPRSAISFLQTCSCRALYGQASVVPSDHSVPAWSGPPSVESSKLPGALGRESPLLSPFFTIGQATCSQSPSKPSAKRLSVVCFCPEPL